MKDSRELVEHALRGVRPARTPIFDILRHDGVIGHFAGQALDGRDDEATTLAAMSNALDGTRAMAVPSVEGSTYRDEMGNAFEAQRWTAWIRQHALNGMDEWVAWIKKNIEELESEEPLTENLVTRLKAQQAEFSARLDGTVYIHCDPSTAVNMAMFGYHCGLDNFTYLWCDHRDLVLRWMNAIQRHELRKIELTGYPELCPMAMIYSDMAFKGALMFSKTMFAELGFFDDLARICDACHRKGLAVIFHSDGYVMDIVPDLVAAGIDGLNPIEKAAGMDIYELRRRYPALILVGGVDVTHLLPHGTPEDVRRETRRIIDETGSEGRLLIGSTTELDVSVPLENYLAFHDEVMKNGKALSHI